jgi:hypothetical protein
MTAAGCICVVCMGLDASAICSTSRADGSWRPFASRVSPDSHVRADVFLRVFVEKGAGIEADGSVRGLGIVATAVSSCSAPSSLAVPVVEFDTLSIDRRDIISSRVDAFIGRTEKREESAFARRLEVTFDPLEGVQMVVADEWERELEGGVVSNMGLERSSRGVLAPDDDGGKNDRLVEGTLRTTREGSKLRGSGWETGV